MEKYCPMTLFVTEALCTNLNKYGETVKRDCEKHLEECEICRNAVLELTKNK